MEEIPIILHPAEVETIAQMLQPSKISQIGTLEWFEDHQILERLRQQCVVEALYNVEERVKDIFLTSEKLPILVHEAVLIQIWREKVWKKLSKITDRKIANGFIGYTVMYHECTAVNFLQLLFHHKETVQRLGDESLDLIDYCVSQIVYLISNPVTPTPNSDDEDEMNRMKAKQEEMAFNIGLASISILASLSEYLEDMRISSVVRIYETHDVPVLMATLMEKQPWKRKGGDGQFEVYNEGKWNSWDREELCKYEAQCWIALRGLLLHPKAREHYELTKNRKETLMKLQKYLHEAVVDQMAPLVELKQLLGHLGVTSQTSNHKPPLILETIAVIREGLIGQGSKWRKLVERHTSLMFDETEENTMDIAKSIAETYDADFLDLMNRSSTVTKEPCHKCNKTATKKCSQCKAVWYCTRKCQVTDWENHKNQCTPPENST